jgi:hypothetical protein
VVFDDVLASEIVLSLHRFQPVHELLESLAGLHHARVGFRDRRIDPRRRRRLENQDAVYLLARGHRQ